MRGMDMGWTIVIVIGVLALVFATYQGIVQNMLHISKMSVTLPEESAPGTDFPGTIVVLSDLHNHSFGRDNERLIKAVRDAKPDLIAIPGDLIIRHRDNTKVAVKLLQALCEIGVPVVYSLGNHESAFREEKPEAYNEYLAQIANENLTVLDNACMRYADGVCICGMSVPKECYYKTGRRYVLTEASWDAIEPEPAKEDYIILLAHTPYYFKQYASFGADLVLAGHLHGGIVRLPRFGGVISPQMELMPKYDAGIYEHEGTSMVVSRGLGTHFPPVRVNNLPELIVLTLEKKRKE